MQSPSLVYYTQAYALAPKDPLINLCLGLTYLHRAMQRQTENRHLQIVQAFALIFKYYRLRNSSLYDIVKRHADVIQDNNAMAVDVEPRPDDYLNTFIDTVSARKQNADLFKVHRPLDLLRACGAEATAKLEECLTETSQKSEPRERADSGVYCVQDDDPQKRMIPYQESAYNVARAFHQIGRCLKGSVV